MAISGQSKQGSRDERKREPQRREKGEERGAPV